jgi:hypothetical protein
MEIRWAARIRSPVHRFFFVCRALSYPSQRFMQLVYPDHFLANRGVPHKQDASIFYLNFQDRSTTVTTCRLVLHEWQLLLVFSEEFVVLKRDEMSVMN